MSTIKKITPEALEKLHLSADKVRTTPGHHVKPMEIYIRYMVSLRCKGVVVSELEKLGISHNLVDFGFVQMPQRLPYNLEKKFRQNLKAAGMQLLSRDKSVGLENMIRAIDNLMANPELPNVKDEIAYIVSKAKIDPKEMIDLFAEVKGISVAQYLLQQKMETAKVWLLYSDVNITDLAEYFNFRDRAAFTRAFKKFTGTPPLFYRRIKKLRALNALKAAHAQITPPTND